MFSIVTVILSILSFISAYNNKVIPSCSSCKWFIPNINAEYGKCKMFLEKKPSKEIIENYPFYNYAKHCRDNEILCGQEGYLFEEKEIDILILMENRLEQLKNIDPTLYEYANFLKK